VVVAVVAALVVIGAATAFFFLRDDDGVSGLTLHEWYSTACLVDANGDDVLDVGGRMGRPGSESQRVMVFDGIDGSEIWSSEPEYGFEAWVMCLSPSTIGVARPDFSVDLYGANGGPPKTMKVADAVNQYGATDDCARLQLLDGTSVTIDLPSRERGECEADLTHSTVGDPITETFDYARSVEWDDATYLAQPKERGTPTLTLSATRDERTLWETPLRYKSVDRQALLAVTPDTVLTYGVDPADDDRGVLVGLDRKTGEVRFEQPVLSRFSTSVSSELSFNGRHAILAVAYGVRAFDPSTGEVVWNAGGRR
jgi:outer membrane protein assembly factor BamB